MKNIKQFSRFMIGICTGILLMGACAMTTQPVIQTTSTPTETPASTADPTSTPIPDRYTIGTKTFSKFDIQPIQGCTGSDSETVRGVVWENTTGGPVYISGISLWIGYGMGSKGDLTFGIWRSNPETILERIGWDHYLDPGGLHQVRADFSSAPVKMESTHWLEYFARNCHLGGPLSVLHVEAIIYFSNR